MIKDMTVTEVLLWNDYGNYHIIIAKKHFSTRNTIPKYWEHFQILSYNQLMLRENEFAENFS